MHRRIITLPIISCLLFLTACASVVSENSYDVAINSSPAQADFVVKDQQDAVVANGVTPAVVHLDASKGFFKGASYSVFFSKSGYGESVAVLRSKVSIGYFGNILFSVFGLLGALAIDPLTGAMFQLPPRLDTTLATSSEPKSDVQ